MRAAWHEADDLLRALAPAPPAALRPDQPSPGRWWCCDADYPGHSPTCPNRAPPENKEDPRG